MTISRRQFHQLALGAGVSLTISGNTFSARTEQVTRRPIPSSGQMIPVVGLGTNRYSVENADSLLAPLKRFYELGGRVVDTAPAYRSSEQALGNLARELGISDELFWASKVDKGTAEELDEQFASSKRRLDTKDIDALQIHNLRSWKTALPQLQQWKDEGQIRYVGITTSRERQFEEFEQVIKSQTLDFIQINYSLEARAAADRILPLAADSGVAVIVNRALGGGRLFRAVGDSPLPDWAGEFDCSSWAQFLLKYVLGNTAVTCVIPGMTKVKHVEDNIAAGSGKLPDVALRARQEELFDSL